MSDLQYLYPVSHTLILPSHYLKVHLMVTLQTCKGSYLGTLSRPLKDQPVYMTPFDAFLMCSELLPFENGFPETSALFSRGGGLLCCHPETSSHRDTGISRHRPLNQRLLTERPVWSGYAWTTLSLGGGAYQRYASYPSVLRRLFRDENANL